MQLDFDSMVKLFGMMATMGTAIVALNRMFISSLIQKEFEKFQGDLKLLTLDVAHKFGELERRFVLAAVHEARYEHLHDRYEELGERVKYLEQKLREYERVEHEK